MEENFGGVGSTFLALRKLAARLRCDRPLPIAAN